MSEVKYNFIIFFEHFKLLIFLPQSVIVRIFWIFLNFLNFYFFEFFEFPIFLYCNLFHHAMLVLFCEGLYLKIGINMIRITTSSCSKHLLSVSKQAPVSSGRNYEHTNWANIDMHTTNVEHLNVILSVIVSLR